MRQDHISGLMTFVTVAEEKNFSSASAKLGISPSAVSQSIRTLEARLGLTLFSRTTRSVSLTEIGQQYLERILPALNDLTVATEELGKEANNPVGQLRINVPRSGWLIVLQPILRKFLETYPEITLDVRLDNHLVDIVSQGFDAGIRFGGLVEKDMVAIEVGPELKTHIIASPDYLARYGEPQHPKDLLEHNCIRFRHNTSGQIERWEFRNGDQKIDLLVNGRVIINDAEALVRTALDGQGIAYMINGYIDHLLRDGRLIRILEDWSPTLPRLYLYYPDRRRVPAKLRALIDFLRSETQGIVAEGNNLIL